MSSAADLAVWNVNSLFGSGGDGSCSRIRSVAPRELSPEGNASSRCRVFTQHAENSRHGIAISFSTTRRSVHQEFQGMFVERLIRREFAVQKKRYKPVASLPLKREGATSVPSSCSVD